MHVNLYARMRAPRCKKGLARVVCLRWNGPDATFPEVLIKAVHVTFTGSSYRGVSLKFGYVKPVESILKA